MGHKWSSVSQLGYRYCTNCQVKMDGTSKLLACPPFTEDEANALNNAADQSQVIEVMRTALERTQLDLKSEMDGGFINDCPDARRGRLQATRDFVLQALAEAQRIMEGK